LAITRATNAPRRSAGTTLQTMISTFEIRKQADQMDDKGDEIEPPTPSLTYRSGRWWPGRFSHPPMSSMLRWAISIATIAASRPGMA